MNGRVTVLTGGRDSRQDSQDVSRTTWYADVVVRRNRGRYRDRETSRTSEAGPYSLSLHLRDRGRSARYRSRLRRARLRQGTEAHRYGLREPDQDDDLAHHLLHHRPGRRLRPEGREDRQGR